VLDRDELRSIQAETLVLWGRQDRFFPLSHGERAASLIPHAKLVVLEDCGHVSVLDQPSQVSEQIEQFLAGGSGPEAGAD